MTDMRATERLLEVIEDRITNLAHHHANEHPAAVQAFYNLAVYDLAQIEAAITELRRRGDTLVHRDDLRLVSEAGGRWWHERYQYQATPVGDALRTSLDRLENAIGGKP